jgi:hypothetical protein
MPSFVIYQLDTDPLGAADVDVVAGFTVDIVDNDDEVENPDNDGTPQFDVSGIPGLTSSTSFEAFESYDGTVGGLPVTFTLIQFSGTPYMNMMNCQALSALPTARRSQHAGGRLPSKICKLAMRC